MDSVYKNVYRQEPQYVKNPRMSTYTLQPIYFIVRTAFTGDACKLKDREMILGIVQSNYEKQKMKISKGTEDVVLQSMILTVAQWLDQFKNDHIIEVLKECGKEFTWTLFYRKLCGKPFIMTSEVEHFMQKFTSVNSLADIEIHELGEDAFTQIVRTSLKQTDKLPLTELYISYAQDCDNAYDAKSKFIHTKENWYAAYW